MKCLWIKEYMAVHSSNIAYEDQTNAGMCCRAAAVTKFSFWALNSTPVAYAGIFWRRACAWCLSGVCILPINISTFSVLKYLAITIRLFSDVG
jgi:hypothetical protein